MKQQSCFEYINHLRLHVGRSPSEVLELLKNSDFSRAQITKAVNKAKKQVKWTVYPTCLNIPAAQEPLM